MDQLDEFAPQEELSRHAQHLIERGVLKRARTAPSKAEIVEQFNSVFEMIGGIPRLALWADENPGQFFAMYSKLLPNAAKIELTVVDEQNAKDVPTSQLKMLFLKTVNGETIDHS